MTTKNALLFCLAVFGVIFIGIDACLPYWGMAQLSGACSAIGGVMLVIFFALVLGFGFILKVAYIGVSCFTSISAFAGVVKLLQGNTNDLVMTIVFAAVTVLLLAFIPKVFLKK